MWVDIVHIATDAKGPNESTCCMFISIIHGVLSLGPFTTVAMRMMFSALGSTFPCFLGALSCALYGRYVEIETFFSNSINVM